MACLSANLPFIYLPASATYIKNGRKICKRNDKGNPVNNRSAVTSSGQLRRKKRAYSKCYQEFSDKCMSNRPSVVHTNEKPYICDICQEGFNQRSTLKRHKFSHKKDVSASLSNSKKVGCLECGKEFSTKYNLKQHSVVHFKKKSFTCDVCQKGFTQKCSLKRHILAHLNHADAVPSGIRKDSKICYECGEAFNTKYDLKCHYLMHKKFKTFICGVCQKRFTEISSLKKHELYHTVDNGQAIAGSTKSLLGEHTCLKCGKAFHKKCNLKQHSVVHLQIKSYISDVCQKCFSRKGDLKKHTFSHTSEKPFQCDVCGKCYRHKVSLNLHALVHKGIKLDKC